MLKKYIAILSLSFLFIACGGEKDTGKSAFDEISKQKARGDYGEIILVITPELWDSPVGEEIASIFQQPIKGLPQEESKYILRKASPSKLNSVLKSSKNLLFVATTDSKTSEGNYMKKYFTDESIQKIENNPSLFSFNQEDVYATGQEVLYLFGRNEKELLANLKKHRDNVAGFFNAKEQDRLIESLKKNSSRGIMNYISDSLGLELLVPFGYDIAQKSDDFLWVRQLDQKEEFNLWIKIMPYNDETVFDPAKIKSLRNELGRNYIVDMDDDSLYLTTQDELPLVIDTVNLNGNYALETRGLWKYSDNSRGGAFVSYLFANEETGILYYVEGYLDNPGEKKREAIRVIEAILNTADIPDTIND